MPIFEPLLERQLAGIAPPFVLLSLSEVESRAREAGVTGLVTIASDPRDAKNAIEIATGRDGVWCTAGLHPHEADQFDDRTVPALRRLAARPEVVAIGEAGLDFHYDNAPRDRQRLCFEAQLELASELGLPIVVHSRDADDDTAAFLASTDARGVLHCFTAGPALLEAGLDALGISPEATEDDLY